MFTIPLDQDELGRAMTFFESRGIRLVQMGTFELGGEPAGTYKTFQADLGRDTRGATQLAFDTFREVYRIPAGSQVRIEEN